MKGLPVDQMERDSFATELDRNFSVIAAAGTGKTAAITKRIFEIAKRKPEWLPRLVVVTFTNRAADEMQQRTRQRIFEGGVPLHVLTAFNRAFFGTIHSFCTKLLTAHGYRLGLPSRLDLIEDDEELWNDFVQRTEYVGTSLSPENRKGLLRHAQLRDLMELGRRGRLPLGVEQRDRSCPQTIDIRKVINYGGSGIRIQADKEALLMWKERFETGSDFLPLIQRASGSEAFSEHWENTFRDFNEWLSCCALKVAGEVQAKYRRFRASNGVVTFDDQIALAAELTQNAEAISSIREKDYIVILDEAQDTDPQQFEILLEITRPLDARGRWLENAKENPPRPGRFCMVGDFQQSIYGDRADLKYYRRVHDALLTSGAGKKLEFSVTFRLDQKQVDFVNDCFPEILNDREDQVGFIQLEPRPGKLPGQVVGLHVSLGDLDSKAYDRDKAKAEATQLASWIQQADLHKLRARSWGEVAVLCPRKHWLAPIADALRRVGIDSQIQSETDVKGDTPAHAWFTALLTVMTQPRCGFEIVGVLREVFGIADHDLAVFSEGCADRFQIEREADGSSVVAATLNFLARLRAEISDKPLFSAVQTIVERMQLRGRLQTLPRKDFENLDRELDVLTQSAAAAEAEGMTLEEFAELLRANFTAQREPAAPRADAVQLITCQKAKGLEWDAVIVPFFSRLMHTRDEDFPRLVIDPQNQDLIVAFSKADLPSGAKGALKKAHVQEMERLLYVALTRARHTLVLAADHDLFGAAPAESLTKWFRSEQGKPNASRVAALPLNAIACERTRAHQSTLISEHPRHAAELPEPLLSKAATRAAHFLRKRNPTSFVSDDAGIKRTGADTWKEAEAEFRARTLPSPATRYGVWWHEHTRNVAWQSSADVWKAAFDQNVIHSPEPRRSRKEWNLLMEYFSDRPDLLAGRVLAEMPFFWRINNRACLEGIIDLAVFRSHEHKWFLLDWKTNQIDPEAMDALREYYRPQIAAYWKAVAEMTKQPVSAGIYSTATGELALYGDEELADEWNRLQNGRAEKSRSEVNGNEIYDSPSQLEFGDW